MRHAKAINGGVLIPDQDRPLSDSGVKDAKRLGSYLSKKSFDFDLILHKLKCHVIKYNFEHFLKKIQKIYGSIIVAKQIFFLRRNHRLGANFLLSHTTPPPAGGGPGPKMWVLSVPP